jgi:hypothetical protein
MVMSTLTLRRKNGYEYADAAKLKWYKEFLLSKHLCEHLCENKVLDVRETY